MKLILKSKQMSLLILGIVKFLTQGLVALTSIHMCLDTALATIPRWYGQKLINLDVAWFTTMMGKVMAGTGMSRVWSATMVNQATGLVGSCMRQERNAASVQMDNHVTLNMMPCVLKLQFNDKNWYNNSKFILIKFGLIF